MHETEFFHTVLDEQPGDQSTRWLLAEFTAERGEPTALGLYWMVRHGKHPLPDQHFTPHTVCTWDWWSMLPGWNNGIGDQNDRPDRLDPNQMRALDRYRRRSNWSGDCCYCEYLTRVEAEEALCRVILRDALGAEPDSRS